MNRHLKEVRKSLRLTQKKMGEILGIGQNAYSMIENGKISLTERNRSILESSLGINPNYLIDGTLPMLLDKEKAALQALQNSQSSDFYQSTQNQSYGIPYISKRLDTSTNRLSEIQDIEYCINFEPFNDCSFYRPVFGNSMSPRYNASDIIACKRINSKNNIIYGNTYLCIIDSDGDCYETLRILRKSESEHEIILQPLNNQFDSSTLPLSALAEIYMICGKIERNI